MLLYFCQLVSVCPVATQPICHWQRFEYFLFFFCEAAVYDNESKPYWDHL